MLNLGQDEFLNNSSSLPAKSGNSQVPWKFGVSQGIQSKHIKVSGVNFKNVVQNTTVSSGTFSIGTNITVSLTTKITNNVPHANDPTFSLPHIAFYLGTAVVSGSQIYPKLGGTAIASNLYLFYSGYDLAAFDGTNTAYTVSMINNSGAAQTIYYQVQHKFLQTNSGTQS